MIDLKIKDHYNQNVDHIYYAHAAKVPLSEHLSIYARDRMFKHFCAQMNPSKTTTILDFGVSEEMSTSSNALERYYPYPENITCAGLGDGIELQKHFPQIHYVPIRPNERLPFSDHTFDIAYSNAVFEHLGNADNQKVALTELLRVAKYVYITVPNAFFPIEHHTAIPLLHYMPSLFRLLIKKTPLSYWSQKEHLEFLTPRYIRTILPHKPIFNFEYCGINFGPFSSNFAFWTPSQ